MTIQRSSWHVIAEIHRAARESAGLSLSEALIKQLEIVIPAMQAHTKALTEAVASCRVANPYLKRQETVHESLENCS